MSSIQPKSTLDGLPKQFVSSLKILFEILDHNGTGYVRFTDVEHRWKDGVTELPHGVVEALRKVTPSNGLLSFERFVAGLKIALLRSKSTGDAEPTSEANKAPVKPIVKLDGTKSQSNLKFHDRPSSAHNTQNERTTATVRPSVIQQRTLSMPQLAEPNNATTAGPGERQSTTSQYNNTGYVYIQRGSDPAPGTTRTGITYALKSWQNERMIAGPRDRGYSDSRTQLGTDKLASEKQKQPQIHTQEEPLPRKTSSSKRREPRRHTLSNGIDYNMLKRMKQLEQEKDVLLQGLEAVERARDWYQKQVQSVQEKQKYVGKSTSPADYSVEAHQERMNFQMARIFEVNQQLKALVESTEKGFPLHMNLAMTQGAPNIKGLAQNRRGQSQKFDEHGKQVSMLKEQNKMLTQEVTQKSDRISQLERDKNSLIKELFQARSKYNKTNYDDATFM